MTRRHPESDMIPTESIAMVIYKLTRHGILRTNDAADVGEYVYRSADVVLNKACRVLPIYKQERGVWALDDEVTRMARDMRPLVARLRRENVQSPGSYSAMPLRNHELIQLLDALDKLLRER